ncbi:hypothetical protein F5X99DRAFT_420161 [Biscogniauxia marginata]|nr:hypothetical protein F5X99DRAFT_420161 [Biscogniauxia marginata]
MASFTNTKRQRAEDRSKEDPPQKKIRSSRERRTPWNYPLRFYDNISKVWLMRLALRELDRRNSIQIQPESSVPAGKYSRDLARFARRGGPDLCHLRGAVLKRWLAVPPHHSLAETRSTKATTLTSKKTSAKDNNFEQHLIDHNFSESAFRDFKRKNLQVVLEDDVTTKVIPIICGNADIPSQQNLLFTEIHPMTTEDTPKPQPDLFDGARVNDLDKVLRDDNQLRPMIIPKKHKNVPVACNFFLEAKGQDGSAIVMKRQVFYDGAYGARAMHSLQNYGEGELVYDGSAFTFSSTYHAGTETLQLYSHHVTMPATPGGRPEYHMNQLDAYALTVSNARDLAKEHRDRFIQRANARARGEALAASDTFASMQRYKKRP